MKKLLTVCWTATVAVDFPEDTTFDDIDTRDMKPELEAKLGDGIKEAWSAIQWSDGEPTDLQDA